MNQYMKKYILLLGVVFSSVGMCFSQLDLNKIKTSVDKTISGATSGTTSSKVVNLTDSEIVQGLKEALSKGATSASLNLNKVDGFYKNPKVKIPLPDEAKKVAKTLREYGYGSKVDEFEKSLNRAGEQAAKEAAPIFKSAITGMSFADAKSILTGPDTAATGYLRKSTYNSLFSSFSPHVKKALGDNKVASKWTEITTIYNKIPLVKKPVNTDLVSYTTHKSLKGVFVMVAEEELKIRKDPVSRTTDILKKVFGSL